MNVYWDRAYWNTVNEKCPPFPRPVAKGSWCGAETSLFSALLGTAALFSSVVCSKSLNSAVDAQLAIIGGIECARLLEGDTAANVLSGGLLGICTRGTPAAGPGSSAAGGGNAATPVTLPGVVEERMGDARDKDESDLRDTDGVVKLGRGINLFVSAEYEALDRDLTDFEDGYDSDIWRLTLGADLQLTQQALAGVALDAYKQDGNFDGGGNFDTKSYGIITFGSWLPTDRTFLQAYGEYAYQSNDRTRVATFTQLDSLGDVDFEAAGRPDADFSANQYSGGILLGYDYPAGNVTIGPRAGFDAVYTDFESYEEKNDDSGLSLGFRSESQTSLQSSLGLQGSVSVSTGFGVVVGQAGLSWKHEFDNDQRNADVYFVDDTRKKNFTYETEGPDRDFFEYNIGLLFVLPNDVQTFVNYRALNGHKYFDNQAVTIGFRVGL